MTNIELKGDIRYIALSHPWGDKRHNNHFCTLHENLSSRIRNGISISDLPDTLRDAVEVTRRLGVRYLWIDTICIIQGPDGDFGTEATRMETVFSLAYCVITASRATGTSSGFLLSHRRRRDFISLPFPGQQSGNLYICEAIDDFQTDVIDGSLNKRGWVLQERALARRTIYFTATQTYFECGAGVRCETLARMMNNQAAFLGDPNFPAVAVQSSKGGRIRLYESLYKTYSALEFTNLSDRPIAIAGLEQRLVRAFDTHGGYGVFDGPFFGRSLLWKRDETVPGNREMRLIDFELRDERSFRVPTWSWMAYAGVISFMDLPFDSVEWRTGSEKGVLSPWHHSLSSSGSGHKSGGTTTASSSTTNTTWHTGKTNEMTVLRARARKLAMPLSQAQEGIIWDKTGGPVQFIENRPGVATTEMEVRCVVVGRQKAAHKGADRSVLQHYVLVVGKTHPMDDVDESKEVYRRLGVGAIPGSWIVQDDLGTKVVIA